jgi:DNA-binding transcriptional MerR regulator
MPGDDPEQGPEERAYRAQRRERLHQIRRHLREMGDHLREMEEHLRGLDEHLRHEVEESERWHSKWDDLADGD